MTADEIRALTLEQLRLEVAKCLGWTDLREQEIKWFCGLMGNPPDFGKSKGVLRGTLPSWPTVDADAVQLLPEATKRGWYWVAESRTVGAFVAFKAYGYGFECHTFAEAVSRAFVLAFWAEKGSGE